MVKSAKPHLEEEEEADDYDNLAAKNDSSSGEIAKVDGKSTGQKANAHRSKHSETEQRRRSKINERFQILRDLIPQNDQKRDKASFLLEVIDYIQFLQEKLQMYEGSYQGWNQGPTKLIPWRSHQRCAESFIDRTQDTKNGSGPDNSVLPSAMLSNVPNPIESDLEPASIYKAEDYTPGLGNPVVLSNMQTEQNMFASIGNVVVPPQPLQESVSVAENMVYQPNSQLWQGRPCITGSAVLNDTSERNDLEIEGGLVSLSTAYSQGILNTLTQALQSSGMDLSQANISVQIDVGKRSNSGLNVAALGSEDHENQILNNQMMPQTGGQNCDEGSDQPHKRVRR